MDKNKAYEMARLSEMAYLDTFEFKKEHSDRRFCFHSVNGTQFYTVWTETELVFAFRGTEITDFADIKADIKFKRVPVGTDHEVGTVHRGFKAALDSVWDVFKEDYDRLKEGRTVTLTGHSLGAALATLAMSRLDDYDAELFTFGSPRVGSRDFKTVFNFKFDKVYRFRNHNDVVTRHPMSFWNYRHVGLWFYFDGDGTCVTNPNFWHRLKQFGSGMLEGFMDKKVDSLSDHSVSNYVKLTREM